jgi:NADH-quinone oxidoreductase subunit L
MIEEAAVWAIIGLPLAAGGLIIFGLRPWAAAPWRYSGLVAILATAGSFGLSLWALDSAIDAPGVVGFDPHEWFTVGDPQAGGFQLTIGVLLDPLSAIMATVVSGVSVLVQIYSLGYMRKDELDGHDAHGAWSDYPRYFAYMALFTAAMLGLVLAYNLIQAFVFWELVGLFSYLLIGFWFHRPAAAAAAKKAFIITRIGDFGFLLALLWLFMNRGQFLSAGANPFEIPDINSLAVAGALSAGLVTWTALGLFAGAVGKSAQFPLNTWLPDAMEGPTPVSSLIHAATMVAAGVFLIARLYPLFAATSAVLNTIALVGGITAVLAALLALVATDIKRVLAFSTVSQLGYMFLALGVGAPAIALFHLFNHAFFKSLLFLSAGSVHHSVHTFDMRYMGGLRRWMPVTYALTLIAGLSLAGIFPFSGFWSKDEVLLAAWSAERGNPGSEAIAQIVFWLGLAAAGLTSFYIFRLIFMTFHGDFRGGIDSVPVGERTADEAHRTVHRGESPWVMWAPMGLLAVLALFSGIVVNGFTDVGPVPAHWFVHFLGGESLDANGNIAIASMAIAAGGIGLAVLIYGTKTISLARMPRPLRMAQRVLEQGFYMDYLYETLIVRRALYRGVFLLSDWFDRRIVDGMVDFIGLVGRNAGRTLGQLQTGQAQAYGIGVSAGVIVLLWAFLIRQ